jgi:glycosyltransferase involved in cell wall biosynthesis
MQALPMKQLPISAVLITLNEEQVIEKTLQALQWCDEIVVVDSGSQDNTLAICQKYGCRVIYNAFEGYGKQKRFAVDCAANHWVFVVDADEVVPAALQQEIQEAMHALPQTGHSAFKLPRANYFMGKVLRFGGEHNKLYIRLFDKRAGNYNEDIVHEKAEIKGTVGRLRNRLEHYSYRDIADYFNKLNKYTTSGAQQYYQRGKKVSQAYIIARFPFTFIQLYVLKGLFMDGFPGFVWALFSSLSPVVKYVKLYEMHQQKASPATTQPRSAVKQA